MVTASTNVKQYQLKDFKTLVEYEKCDCEQDGELADSMRLVILQFNQSVISPLHLLQAT